MDQKFDKARILATGEHRTAELDEGREYPALEDAHVSLHVDLKT